MTTLDFIVQCLGCKFVKTELGTNGKSMWIPFTEYPAYGWYFNNQRISHGYCVTCGDKYLSDQGLSREDIKKILGEGSE